MATALENLKQAREDLITQVALESAYCAAHGPKPSYSLDGESYQWSEWREAAGRKIEQLNKLIQAEKPFWFSSRGRA
jgi:thymidylate synthase